MGAFARRPARQCWLARIAVAASVVALGCASNAVAIEGRGAQARQGDQAEAGSMTEPAAASGIEESLRSAGTDIGKAARTAEQGLQRTAESVKKDLAPAGEKIKEAAKSAARDLDQATRQVRQKVADAIAPKKSAERGDTFSAQEKGSKSAAQAAPRPEAVPAPPEVPTLLKEVERRYAEAGTVSAKFTQVTESAAIKQRKESSGLIFAQRPGKVRWETLSPDKNLLVSDGRTYWFYTPPFDETEPGQLIEKRARDIQSRFANALLAGQFSSERGLKIEAKSPTRFVLTPRRGTAGTVKTAEIAVDPAAKTITEVTLRHRDGNLAEIRLTEVKLGEKLDERLFGFVAPPGTERIRD